MKFSKKIFISVFVTTLVLGTGLVYIAYKYVSDSTERNFVERYSVFTNVMGDTLTYLDKNSEKFMLNTAKIIAEKDAKNGLLSTEELKSLRDELSVTHLFVLDKKGNFVRSTNEDPKLIPNVFNFCQEYRKTFAQRKFVEATPIIQPMPEPKPYKFLFIPSQDNERILEVGMRVDFVAKTLTEALGSDKNLVALSLYSPNGNLFARFNSKEFNFVGPKEALPDQFPAVIDSGEILHVYSKVASSHPQCCQCNTSGISKNGEYYYILDTEVSKKELSAIQAGTQSSFVLLAFVNLLFAFALSRIVSRRLVKNIEMASERVRSLERSGDFSHRIGIEGQDEVSYLTKEFDRLLDTLEESQRKVVESEKVQFKVQLAREVAHNIKSPIVAIEMMLPMLVKLPDRMQKVFRDSVREIKSLSDRLSRQADTLTSGGGQKEIVFLPKLLKSIVAEKQIEYPAYEITFESEGLFVDTFVDIDAGEFKAVISNLINNAFESYDENPRHVVLKFNSIENFCVVSVSDEGRGMPAEVMEHLGKRSISIGKANGKGIGLLHAHRTITGWLGTFWINSNGIKGTIVSLSLPKTASCRADEVITVTEKATNNS